MSNKNGNGISCAATPSFEPFSLFLLHKRLAAESCWIANARFCDMLEPSSSNCRTPFPIVTSWAVVQSLGMHRDSISGTRDVGSFLLRPFRGRFAPSDVCIGLHACVKDISFVGFSPVVILHHSTNARVSWNKSARRMTSYAKPRQNIDSPSNSTLKLDCVDGPPCRRS